MTIRATCSGCSTKLKLKDSFAGKTIKCPRCKTGLTIPRPKSDVSPDDIDWVDDDAAAGTPDLTDLSSGFDNRVDDDLYSPTVSSRKKKKPAEREPEPEPESSGNSKVLVAVVVGSMFLLGGVISVGVLWWMSDDGVTPGHDESGSVAQA